MHHRSMRPSPAARLGDTRAFPVLARRFKQPRILAWGRLYALVLQKDWAESAQYSRAWIQLDPEDFPAAYLLNALANARLNKMEEAERAAREGVRVDKDHQVPRLSYVLGVILMEKHAYSESEKCLRTFLELSPNAKDAPLVRAQLVELNPVSSKGITGR